jgi:ribosome maturation factor RimP
VADQLEAAVSEILASLGYDLVEFRQVGAAQRPILQVRIDLPGSIGAAGVSSDDCVRASRALEQALEERGLVGAHYTLEVSSPGDDRPLRNPADWRRFLGSRIKIRHHAIPGTTYGIIEEVDDISAQRVLVMVRPEDGTETMSLDLAQMREARLAPDLKPKPKPGKAAKPAAKKAEKKKA